MEQIAAIVNEQKARISGSAQARVLNEEEELEGVRREFSQLAAEFGAARKEIVSLDQYFQETREDIALAAGNSPLLQIGSGGSTPPGAVSKLILVANSSPAAVDKNQPLSLEGIDLASPEASRLAFQACYSDLCKRLEVLETRQFKISFITAEQKSGLRARLTGNNGNGDDSGLTCQICLPGYGIPFATFILPKDIAHHHLWIRWEDNSKTEFDAANAPHTLKGAEIVSELAIIEMCTRLEKAGRPRANDIMDSAQKRLAVLRGTEECHA